MGGGGGRLLITTKAAGIMKTLETSAGSSYVIKSAGAMVDSFKACHKACGNGPSHFLNAVGPRKR